MQDYKSASSTYDLDHPGPHICRQTDFDQLYAISSASELAELKNCVCFLTFVNFFIAVVCVVHY